MVINILYPALIDNNTSLPNVIDTVTSINAEVVNRLKSAIIAVETELGIKPASIYGTVRNRLDVLENVINQGGGGMPSFAGDLMAVGSAQEVIGFYGRPLSNVVPTVGQCYAWNGTQWAPQIVNNFTPAGDLSGNSSLQTVTGLYNHPLASTTPIQSAVPVWDIVPAKYDIRQLTLDDILPAFAITGFSGGSVVECGVTVTNPSFTASYSAPPVSAQITNTDGIDSPLVLTTPFTSGTVIGSFTHSTVNAAVTFTLTATAATTKTATQSITYEARSFGGLGTTGATSATASSNNAVLVGATGTLSNEGIHGSDVGQVYGPFNPVSQNIYLLLPHTVSPHTFKDQNGFTFAMNAPTTFSFTNQHGAVLSMDLYQSTLSLSTTFTITVVS